MRTQRDLDLSMDIAKLLKKYGPEPFETLAESISSPLMTQHLTHILSEMAKISRTVPKVERKTKLKQEPSIPRSLVALKNVESGKYQILLNFYTELVAKRVLPSLRDIKEFARECGLPEVRAKSRQKAISPLVGSLSKFPNEELIARIQSLKNCDISDRSLEGWSNIILNRQQRSGEK